MATDLFGDLGGGGGAQGESGWLLVLTIENDDLLFFLW